MNDGPTSPKVVTLTVNPAIDIAASVDRVVPLHKLRCTSVRRDPGGGGINVDVGRLYDEVQLEAL